VGEPEVALDDDLDQVLLRLSEGQDLLRQDLEKIAGHLRPLLTEQYRGTEVRIRALETCIRNRRERPLILVLANLLSDVRRLDSDADVKVHVEETVLDALFSAGYQEFGAPGDPFDPARYEPLSGSIGAAGVVRQVHRHGLECYGDVIIKAQVEIGPAPAPTEPGEAENE
jgi:hypothetical protein